MTILYYLLSFLFITKKVIILSLKFIELWFCKIFIQDVIKSMECIFNVSARLLSCLKLHCLFDWIYLCCISHWLGHIIIIMTVSPPHDQHSWVYQYMSLLCKCPTASSHESDVRENCTHSSLSRISIDHNRESLPFMVGLEPQGVMYVKVWCENSNWNIDNKFVGPYEIMFGQSKENWKLRYIIMHNVIWANQKTSNGYTHGQCLL